MKILGFPEDVTRLDRKERRKFWTAAAAFGQAMAEQDGTAAHGHSPRLLGELFAFAQLMGRGPREEEMGDLYQIATAEPREPTA